MKSESLLNQKFFYFSFWQPVIFTLNDNPGTTKFFKLAFTLGSLADQFASLIQKTLSVKAEPINTKELCFEKKDTPNVPHWQTALKISLYIFSAGSLLLIALVIKAVFKTYLNSCNTTINKSPNVIFAEKQFGQIFRPYVNICSQNLAINPSKNLSFFQTKRIMQEV